MNILLTILGNLWAALSKALPYFLAYKAGSNAKQHDFDEAIKKVLEEDNEELRNVVSLPDAAIANKLRDRAAQKRKDQD